MERSKPGEINSPARNYWKGRRKVEETSITSELRKERVESGFEERRIIVHLTLAPLGNWRLARYAGWSSSSSSSSSSRWSGS